jgi:hypothetical protein
MTINPLSLPDALEQLLLKIISVNGTIEPQRRILDLTGSITPTDDPANDTLHLALSGGGGGFTAGGDLSGSSSTQQVIGLLSKALPTLAPGYLNYDGIAWHLTGLSGSFPPSGPAGGDLSGTYPNPEVIALLNHILPALAVGALSWTGSAWAFTTSSPVPPPGATITNTPGSPVSAQWSLFQSKTGGYTIPLGTIVAGVPYRFWNVPGGTSNLAIDPVTLDRGSNTFTIEDPSNVLAAPANGASLQVPGGRYDYMLDSTNNVFRCMRQVQ